MPERPAAINWDYDEDANVLYLSVSEPRQAVGVDIGEGVILRYDIAGLHIQLLPRNTDCSKCNSPGLTKWPLLPLSPISLKQIVPT